MTKQNRAEIWLNKALEMEHRGRDYYLAAAKKAADDLARDFFNNLADQELYHIEAIKKIYAKLGDDSCWLAGGDHKDGGKDLNQLFLRLNKNQPKVEADILAALDHGLKFETETAALYEQEIPRAECAAEKEFLTKMVGEERGHHQMLADMKLFYTDPEAWADKMDGGHLDGA